MLRLNVNGVVREIDAEPDMPLLWAVRDLIGLTGSKYGCGAAQCGACTMLVDGQPVRSCVTPVSAIGDASVVTIEGVSGKVAEAVQASWIKLNVAQCGYCQSGQVVAAVALLDANRKPTDADIDAAMSGNICRCAAYQRIRGAIHDAARTLGA